MQNESGNLELPYDDGRQTRPMRVYYRWLGDGADNRSLLVIGITDDNVLSGLTTAILIQIAITFLVNTAFVVLLCYLGNIYQARQGPKWRSSL